LVKNLPDPQALFALQSSDGDRRQIASSYHAKGEPGKFAAQIQSVMDFDRDLKTRHVKSTDGNHWECNSDWKRQHAFE